MTTSKFEHFAPNTTFTPAKPESAQLLKQKIPAADRVVPLGCANGGEKYQHACAGQIQSWIYQGADGATHVAVTVWYACNGHMEILSDVVVP